MPSQSEDLPMSDEDQPGRGELEDEALHQQSRAQLERLRSDPKAQKMLEEAEKDLEPGEDPAFWDVASSSPAAPESETVEHHVGVKPASPTLPDDSAQSVEKVVLNPEALAAQAIATLASEAGIDAEEFKKLPRGDVVGKTVVSAHRVAKAERTVTGTARLDQLPGFVAEQPQSVDYPAPEGGFDPTVKTVGGRTQRGLPGPDDSGPEPDVTSGANETTHQPEKAGPPLLMVALGVLVVIGLAWLLLRTPSPSTVETNGPPSADATGRGPIARTARAAEGPSPAAAPAHSSSKQSQPVEATGPSPADHGPAAVSGAPAPPVSRGTSTSTPPLPNKPRPSTHGPPRPTASELYPPEI